MSLNTSIHNPNLTTSDEIRVNSVIIDKNNISSLSGSFIRSQGNINQSNVLKLLE